MKTKIGVKILPREVLLDSQGRAVEQTLRLNQMPKAQVRVGKYVELSFDLPPQEALIEAKVIAQKVLINPLIENFLLEEIKS